ncbi:MAG: uroporphyrinogen decarboxylase family protein [Candidatus Latescibacter sp.]|nr:uroporphyrinogen decarboxylase family protein [Candidatus Latescibacter sp.]
MRIESRTFLPVEIVFHPNWWYHHAGITFDRAFFFDPDRRVKDEMKMRRVLWERFGQFKYGEENPAPRPVIGPVHLAAGFMVSSLWGCSIRYYENNSPVVESRHMTLEELDAMPAPDPMGNPDFRDLFSLIRELKNRFGYVEGDIGWGNLQNLALDLIGHEIFLAYYDDPAAVHRIYDKMNRNIIEVLALIRAETGTTSISVNRSVEKVDPAINLQSNCSVQMISNETYEEFLLPHELALSARLQPYGIHHCGDNMHQVAPGYAKVKEACFFDVGWGAEIEYCRSLIKDAFFNIRLSPVKIQTCSPDEVERDMVNLLEKAGDLSGVGICCINMDYGAPDENVARIFEVAEKYRKYGG